MSSGEPGVHRLSIRTHDLEVQSVGTRPEERFSPVPIMETLIFPAWTRNHIMLLGGL